MSLCTPVYTISLVSTSTTKIYGIFSQKGAILEVSDADITVFDPEKRRVIDHGDLGTPTDWSPYQGWEVTGNPVMSFLRGRLIAENGKSIEQSGYGKFLKRDKSGNYV